MTDLADRVLPLIRTSSDLHRWSAANRHGSQMHDGLAILEESFALGLDDPDDIYAVTTKAIASSTTIIMRADDSSGIIGDVVRDLLALPPKAAEAAAVPRAKLVKWMIDFQFHSKCDFFSIDPVAYAPALGPVGINLYRDKLAVVRESTPPEPSDRFSDGHFHARFALKQNDRRLAVLNRDIDQIVATHVPDPSIPIRNLEAAKALAEIDEIDLAIEYAQKTVDAAVFHQATQALTFQHALISEHRPDQLLAFCRKAFNASATSTTASWLYRAAGDDWPAMQDEVVAALVWQPDHAVSFALTTLNDPVLAWRLATDNDLTSIGLWLDLIKKYEKIDPLACLPILQEIVESYLEEAKASNYVRAARQIKRMRKLATGTTEAANVDAFLAKVRHDNRNRPRLQAEFTKAKLP